jgi:hypothetical protein
MPDLVPFGGVDYFILLGLLFFSRGMDILSTRVATPNLILEANPIVRFLGWRWSIVLNLGLCAGLAISILSSVIICTLSLLVAARNFQSAWLMRALGEEFYRSWHAARLRESNFATFVYCLLAQTALTAIVGGAVIYYSPTNPVPFAIGVGIVIYAVAVAFFTLLSVWRIRRVMS